MREPPSFTDAIRRVAGDLRDGGDTHPALNRASSAIDHLGRKLHGIGYVRGGEIAACFTTALAELDRCHRLPREKRGDAVHRAADQMDAAVEHAAAGTLPDPPP